MKQIMMFETEDGARFELLVQAREHEAKLHIRNTIYKELRSFIYDGNVVDLEQVCDWIFVNCTLSDKAKSGSSVSDWDANP